MTPCAFSGDVVNFLYPYVHSARAAGAVTLWIGLTGGWSAPSEVAQNHNDK